MKYCNLVVAIAAITVTASALSGCVSVTDEQIRDKVSELAVAPYTEIAVTPTIDTMVRERFFRLLKDPASLQLSKVRAARTTLKTGQESVLVCGLYNSKNSFGAYAGFDIFMMEIVGGVPGSLSHDSYMAERSCSAVGIYPT